MTLIKLYDVAGDAKLPEIKVDQIPESGDPIEVEGEMYYVCEQPESDESIPSIGVIPLVVRNPSSVSNIRQYVDCLSVAHRKVQFKNRKGETDLEHSDEMIIS
ncbi:MAG TPA: hypothetical protein VK155_09050 [Bacteroidales bacterium]|jgi:hypothetical protein|nr:hypothetical protein [Bacteroidales bacterium]